MIQRDSVIPIYFQIQQILRHRIASGELRPGDRVESERELAKKYNISLMTARQALQGLEREGLLHRQRGRGSFVAVPKIEMNQLLGFSEKMRMRGIRPSSKLLLGERISAQPEIVEKLRLPQWAPVFKIIRLRLGDGEPFAVETSYVPEALCPDLLKRDLEGDSLYRLLESEYGIELEHAEEIIEAVVARKRETEWLGIKVGAPLLFVKQVLYGRLARSPAANPVAAVEGWPILYEESLYRADKYQISVRLTRPRLRSERWGEGNP